MKTVDIKKAAADAVTANPNRPATAVVHDTDDARLIVFRLSPGQLVPPHRNGSTVTLTVVSGHGFIAGEGEERDVAPGETVIFAPNELHGMRATTEQLVLLATITPRPGSRSAAATGAVVAEQGSA